MSLLLFNPKLNVKNRDSHAHFNECTLERKKKIEASSQKNKNILSLCH